MSSRRSLRLSALLLSFLVHGRGTTLNESTSSVELEVAARDGAVVQLIIDEKKRKQNIAKLASRELTSEEKSAFERDGWIIVRGLFSSTEVDILRETIEVDPAIAGNLMPMADSYGRVSKLSLWNVAGDDTYGYFARGRRWVHAAEGLIQESVYHFHTKVMMKEPRTGGTWEWHQDFGYWYQVGCLEPDKMLSAILAVDNHTRSNGCMQLLSGSHRLGRLPHSVEGEQAGADSAAVAEAQERFQVVHAVMTAGDVLFTHSNLLHASAPNLSPTWRRSLIVAFNAISNPPRAGTVCPLPSEAPVRPLFDDTRILERGPKPHSRGAAAAFLDHDRNAAQFSRGAE